MDDGEPTPTHIIDFKLPLHSEDHYLEGQHVDSPATTLWNYCVLLKVYPRGFGFTSQGPGVATKLVFVPIYTDSEDTLNSALSGKTDELTIGDVRFSLTVRYAGQKETRQGSPHRLRCGKCNECFTLKHAVCKSEALLVPPKYVPGEYLHCLVELWFDPKNLGYEPSKRRRLDYGKDLWRDMKFTDMTMRAGDEGEDLPCHRAVLARSSEVFDRMLSSQMKEGSEHRIVIRNAASGTLNKLLEHIYTGEAPESTSVQELGELICLGNQLRKHRVISLIHTILEEAKVKVGQDPELVAALVDAI